MDDRKMVFLVTTGSGQDGDEWNVESIHATRAGAEMAQAEYINPRRRLDGSIFFDANIEEWPLMD